jgi:hypothetical protein
MRYRLFLLYGKEGKVYGARDGEAEGQKQILSGTHSLAGRAHQKITHDPNGRGLVVGRPAKVAGGVVNPDPPLSWACPTNHRPPKPANAQSRPALELPELSISRAGGSRMTSYLSLWLTRLMNDLFLSARLLREGFHADDLPLKRDFQFLLGMVIKTSSHEQKTCSIRPTSSQCTGA